MVVSIILKVNSTYIHAITILSISETHSPHRNNQMAIQQYIKLSFYPKKMKHLNVYTTLSTKPHILSKTPTLISGFTFHTYSKSTHNFFECNITSDISSHLNILPITLDTSQDIVICTSSWSLSLWSSSYYIYTCEETIFCSLERILSLRLSDDGHEMV